MGARITEVNEKSNGVTEQTNGSGGGKTSQGSRTTTTTSRGTGGERGGERGTTATATTEKQSKDISGLAILTDQEKIEYENADDERRKIIIRNAKRRERYWRDKEQGKEPNKKPKQVRKSKDSKPKISSEQLTLILGGISSAIASRKGCEHWQLTEQESKSITEPLSKMIEESSLFENIGQYSNQIALVTACITIFTPRIFITVQKMREGKKQNGIIRQQPATTTRTSQGSNNQTDKRNIQKSTTNHVNDVKNVPWYGDAIC